MSIDFLRLFLYLAFFMHSRSFLYRTIFRPTFNRNNEKYSTTVSFSTNVNEFTNKIGNDLHIPTRRPKVIFVLGGPGAGKGTQCAKLSSEFGIKHLSAGELLREEKSKPTDIGRLIDSYLKEGKIVPVEISLNLLRGAIKDLNWNRYLVDGFPRNWDNLQGWDRMMEGIIDVESVLFIDCDEAELSRRLVSRGKYSGRDDDNEETARKRFVTFKESTIPVVEHFKQESNSRLAVINGCQSVEAVYGHLKAAILPHIEREIVEVTQCFVDSLYHSQNSSVKAIVANPVVQVDGQRALITYDLVERSKVSNMNIERDLIIAYLLYLYLKSESGALSELVVEKRALKQWELIDGRWR